MGRWEVGSFFSFWTTKTLKAAIKKDLCVLQFQPSDKKKKSSTRKIWAAWPLEKYTFKSPLPKIPGQKVWVCETEKHKEDGQFFLS